MGARPTIDPLSLTLDGNAVPMEKFESGIKAFFELIREVSEAHDAQGIKWIITVDKGSSIVRARPRPRKTVPIRVVRSVTRTVSNGVKFVQRGGRRPVRFTDDAVQSAKELAQLIDVKTGDVTKVDVASDGVTVPLTPSAVARADMILGGPLTERASLEGRILTISELRGPHFMLRTTQYPRAVRCNYKDDIEDVVLASFRKRVVVHGRMSFHRDGEPISMQQVENVTVIGDGPTVSFRDVEGILGGK